MLTGVCIGEHNERYLKKISSLTRYAVTLLEFAHSPTVCRQFLVKELNLDALESQPQEITGLPTSNKGLYQMIGSAMKVHGHKY